MKTLIFSDSHMSDVNMMRVLEMHGDSFDACLHLGDGCREFKMLSHRYPDKPFVCVNGNYEDNFDSSFPSQTVIDLDGYRMMMTHGHKYFVKNSKELLLSAARDRDCDAVLFGHTHESWNRYYTMEGKKPIYMFNPGSISLPRDPSPTYGVMHTSPKGILLNVARLQ